LVSRATAAFWEPQCPTYSEGPSSDPSANETDEAADDVVLFEDLDHNAMDMETMTAAGGHGQDLGEAESLFNASLECITKDIDEFYTTGDSFFAECSAVYRVPKLGHSAN
jgi:hypothetical protein